MSFRRLLLVLVLTFLTVAAVPSAQRGVSGWECPVCRLESPGGTQASFEAHFCSAHPFAYSGRGAAECGISAGGTSVLSGSNTTMAIGNAVIGLVGALGSWFDQRAREMELSAIQQRYVEEARRQAAEALERERLRRQLQFTREKQAVLDQMKGPRLGTLEMKGPRLPGELKMKDPRAAQTSALATAKAAADRVRDRVQRLRTDLQIDETGLLRFQRDNIEYRRTHPDADAVTPMLTGPAIMRTANAVLVGGTGWVYGYNVPPGQSQTTALRNLDSLLALADPPIDRSQFPNPADYNMILGVAKTQDSFVDLLTRVTLGWPGNGDQLTNGAFTAESQPLYASLRGTQTSRLDCHSNGAMVCLAALNRRDVIAEHVRLFGPQITSPALAQWQSLVETQRIKSLEINITNGDPVGPASYEFGAAPPSLAKDVKDAAYVARILTGFARNWGDVSKVEPFTQEGAAKLRSEIQRLAPAVHVNVLDDPGCRARLAEDKFACHSMTNYQRLTSR